MRLRRRRALVTAAGSAQVSVVMAPRVERALMALAVHAQQLDDRIERLERRIDVAVDATLDLPTHDDVLAVRVHSAKVAAELARVNVELRGHVADAMAEARNARRAARREPSPRERRMIELAETIIDLSDRIDTQPADHVDRAAG